MRWIAIAALVVAVAAGILSTRPAPRAGIAQQVAQAHAAVSGLAPGDLVLLSVDFDPANVPELSPFVRLVLDMALTRGARVVTMSLSPHGAMLAERYLRDALAANHATYGRDAFDLGFVEGRAAAVHLLGLPLQRMATRDHAGTFLGDLPLAQDLARLDDADLVVVAGSGAPGNGEWILQGQGRFARRLVLATSGAEGSELAPFLASGQLAGLVAGARDVAAFADLAANDPRLRTSYLEALMQQMRAQRWAHLALVLCLMLGQGALLWRDRKKGTA